MYLSSFPLTKTSILKLNNLNAQYNNKYECRIVDSLERTYNLPFELLNETQGELTLLCLLI